MKSTLPGKLTFGRGVSDKSKRIELCAVCEARLPPNAIFCLECDPPLPLAREPEEIGISFEQTLLRIGALIILFLVVAYAKLEMSFDRLFPDKQGIGEIKPGPINKQLNDEKFETVHIVKVPLANIRSKASLSGNIVMVAEKGMNLEIIEVNERWSKVRVLEKIGWISNELFESEIQAP